MDMILLLNRALGWKKNVLEKMNLVGLNFRVALRRVEESSRFPSHAPGISASNISTSVCVIYTYII